MAGDRMTDPQMNVVTGLIKAGSHIVLTGKGAYGDPYVISTPDPDIGDLLSSGAGIHLDGDGTRENPAKISVILLGIIEAGTNITRTGLGTGKSKMVLSANATGLIEAGTNVTLTGTGTATDPYVISAAGGGAATHLVAGENVTITGTGTKTDPYVVNAATPTIPVNTDWVTLKDGLYGQVTITSNPDGTILLDGTIQTDNGIPKAIKAGTYMEVGTYDGNSYAPPGDSVTFPTYMMIVKNGGFISGELAAIRLDIRNKVTVITPDIPEGHDWAVWFDGITYRPYTGFQG